MLKWKINKGWETAPTDDLLNGYLDIMKAVKYLPRFEFWSYFNIDGFVRRSLYSNHQEKLDIINELLNNWEKIND